MKRPELETGFATLRPWVELPVWAALMIKNTAPGLALPDRWEGFEWWSQWPGEERIVVHASGFAYNVIKGRPYVF